MDEALFHAGIHPERPASSLDKEEIQRLYAAIKTTLAEAIEKGGHTIRSYVNSQGQIGMFQAHLNYLLIPGRGSPVRHAAQSWRKGIVGGRGTVYCLPARNEDEPKIGSCHIVGY